MKHCLIAIIAILFVAVGCRKIEMDGEKEIIIIEQPGNGNTPINTITLQGRIDSNLTLKKENSYLLKGVVYIVNNKTLTIEPGTVIKAAYTGTDVASLVITRGAKILAEGTTNQPIIFTSSSPNPQSGDWGGIVLCGKASINTSYLGKQGLYQVEGGIDNNFGDGLAGSGDDKAPTPIDDDNSGILKYVRIEYAGYAFQPDKEINSLTMAAVGSNTTIEYIQVSFAKDDAFEWFGGTVNAKYLIAYKTLDDDFDTDNGYSGKVQFGLVIRDSLLADGSRSEAFESDNNSSGSLVLPKTTPVFSNITAIGPRATTTNIGNALYRGAAHLRRNTGISIFNSIIMGWPLGIEVDASSGSSTALNIEDSTMRLRNITIAGTAVNTKFSGTPGLSILNDVAFSNWFLNPYYDNDILANNADVKLINPFNYSSPDPTPFAGSNGNAKVNNGAGFNDAKFSNDNFFDKTVTFRGAIAPAGPLSSWWKGWTKFGHP